MLESRKVFLVNAVLNYFSSLNPITPGFIQEIEKNLQPILVKKNKYILSPIDNNDDVFFVVSGLVRGFIKDDGKEITTWISLGNEFIGAIQHPDENIQPSIEYLQALENSELVPMPRTFINKLYSSHQETNVIGRKILALQYHAASERSILARIPSAERRYEKFLELNSFDVSKVPLRCIASYLGMRLETLSRIRSRLVKELV
ncbi:Crp/Fnr family transcriptional regulator [Pedobacter roseus]|jgi:CRP-like cAMP-binding protein|uniref:Crp/Fnr family transcriptional regulator n=1 Tax=Pedobacter roseus TaxID=336820 RepID=A0A7G9QIC9_9SPHI|nr:Crp/Fnr family transcriptional regulator [Pedobacter roseus]QNN43104.1 Crp/Fnr family transcriptional regulator [Pedobacter roseus]